MHNAYSQGVVSQPLGSQTFLNLTTGSSRLQADIRPRYYALKAGLVMLLGAVLRLWDLSRASFWTDEATSALRAGGTLHSSIDSIMASGNQTPAYFMLLRLMPNQSELALRLPSVVLGVIGIGLIMLVTVSLYGQYRLSLWVGMLLAVNPYHVWLSRTARPYAMMFVLALAISYLFLLMIRGERSRKVWIGFGALSMLAYVTQYTLLALGGAQFLLIAMMLRTNRWFIKRWIVTQVVAIIPLLVWLFFLIRYPLQPGPEWVPVPTWRDISLTLWNMTLGYDGAQAWFVGIGLMLSVTGLAIGMLTGVQERRSSREGLYWTLLVVIPFGLIFGVSTLIVSFYVDRYFMVLLPALLFLIPLGWQKISPALWQLALVVIILLSGESILVTMRTGTYQRSDWRGVAEYMEHNAQPDDVILFERDNQEYVFSRYYTPDEERQPAELLLTDRSLDVAGSRVWVVYRNPIEDVHRFGEMPDFDPFDPSLSAMGQWLTNNRAYVVDIESFNGIKVLLLQMGQQAYAEAEANPVFVTP